MNDPQPDLPTPLKVLVVDADERVRESLAGLLGIGARCIVVGSAGHTGHALALMDQFKPDVIFLDIGLPVMNGYAVARALREMPEFSHVHIAAVTGWGQDDDRQKAREAGCDSHFTKPLDPAMLEDLLATIAVGS